jgi:hypothetical protein
MPIELQQGLLWLLKRLRVECGIDISPFMAGDFEPPPIAMFRYRGHPNQSRDPRELVDRHSVLIDSETLLSLDEEIYLEVTKGKPDPASYLVWVKEVLPKVAYDLAEHSPLEIKKFFRFLGDLQIQAELEKNILDDVYFPHSVKTVGMQPLLDHLRELGIDHEERLAPTHFWKLSRCPVCEKRTSGPYLVPNGRVRCFSTGCEACREDGGLPVTEWAGEELANCIKIAPEEKILDFKELEDAEKLVHDHLRKEGDLALAITPGVGKTREGVAKALDLAQDGIVVYAMPRHNLIEEWTKTAKAMAKDGVTVFHLRGRRVLGEKGRCFMYERVRTATQRGYFPAMTACLRCEHRPKRARGKPAGLMCPYYNQFNMIRKDKGTLVFCTTSQLPYLLFHKEIGEVQHVFIDEQALQAMIQVEKNVGLDEMLSLKPYLSGDTTGIIEKIEQAAKRLHTMMKEKGRIARLYSKEPGGTPWEGMKTLWDAAGVSKAEARRIAMSDIASLLPRQWDLYDEGVNRSALLWLEAAVGDESLAWVEIRRDAKSPIQFQRLHRWTIPNETKVTVLDATATHAELKALFRREFDLLSINVAWEGRRVWLNQGMGKTRAPKLTETELTKRIEATLRYVPPDARRGLLVTHKNIEKAATGILQKIRPCIKWQSTHYFASRGLNSFEDAEVVICLGVPVKSPVGSSEEAAVLFPDDHSQQRRWMKEQNEAELYQSAHRARFVRNPGRTLIVMGHYWPFELLGRPDMVEDRRRKGGKSEEALERALTLYDALGFFTKELAALVGIGMEKDRPKLETIQEGVFNMMKGLNDLGRLRAYHLLYRLYIRVDKPTPLLYSSPNFWTTLLAAIREKRGGTGTLSVGLTHWGLAWSHGVGAVDAARTWQEELSRAARELGREVPEFKDDCWRQETLDVRWIPTAEILRPDEAVETRAFASAA